MEPLSMPYATVEPHTEGASVLNIRGERVTPPEENLPSVQLSPEDELPAVQPPPAAKTWQSYSYAPTGEPTPQIDWVWERIIPRGYPGMINGQGGVAKTTFVTQLAVSVAAGRPCFGVPTTKGHVVILALEDGYLDYKVGFDVAMRELLAVCHPDLRADAIASVGRNLHVIDWTVRQDNTRLIDREQNRSVYPVKENIESMKNDIREHIPAGEPIQLLVIETTSIASGGEEDQAAACVILGVAKGLAKELGCAVAFTHHTGKGQARDGVVDAYAARGASTFADNSRFVLNLVKMTAEESERILGVRMSDESCANAIQLVHAKSERRYACHAPIALTRKIQPLGEGIYLKVLTPEDATAMAVGTGDGVTRDIKVRERAERLRDYVAGREAQNNPMTVSQVREIAPKLALGSAKTLHSLIDFALSNKYLSIEQHGRSRYLHGVPQPSPNLSVNEVQNVKA